jgi:hypothetical protein
MFITKQTQNSIILNIEIYYKYFIIYHMYIRYKIIYAYYIYNFKLNNILLWASLDKNVKHNIHP